MKRARPSLGLLLLVGCHTPGPPGGPADASRPAADLALPGGAGADLSGGAADLSRPPAADLATPPDLLQGTPSELDCYYNWKTLVGCPAPQITQSFLSQDCVGTTGVYVVGDYFQSGNQYVVNNGWLPYGPTALTPKLNRDTWNWITPRMLCITTSSDPSYWSGFTMQIQNPDGQTSNAVTVADQLAGRPALPSTGSSDPFDPNACWDAGMTMAQAVARFPAGATMTTLGDLTIQSRSRTCNTLTGCAAWGAAATVATVAAGLQTSMGGVHFALGGSDCGVLGATDYMLTYNSCATAGAAGGYSVHVAGSCLMLWQTVRSAIAGDGSYTQTDYGGVLRY